jgi:hypothetical protein
MDETFTWVSSWFVLGIVLFSLCLASENAEEEHGASPLGLGLEYLSSFGLGICIWVISARANKRSSNISAFTGQMPVFLKLLSAFPMAAAFPHAAKEN